LAWAFVAARPGRCDAVIASGASAALVDAIGRHRGSAAVVVNAGLALDQMLHVRHCFYSRMQQWAHATDC
jgi:hypothetical protein